MSLPEHRQDLLDLQKQIEAKLANLVVHLAVTGEWIETHGQRCVMPEGVNKTNTDGEWMNEFGHSIPLLSFDPQNWHFSGIKAIRLTKRTPVLNLDGETKINHFHGMIPIPDNIGDYEFQWEAHGGNGWSDGIHLTSWNALSWQCVGTIKIRKKLPKEQKVELPIEFTTYVEGVTKFKTNYWYLVKSKNGPKNVFCTGQSWAMRNLEITHYIELGPQV